MVSLFVMGININWWVDVIFLVFCVSKLIWFLVRYGDVYCVMFKIRILSLWICRCYEGSIGYKYFEIGVLFL